jgi:hypothetical protein
MTSDKSGPVRTATPALEEDLDDTRVRNDVTGKQALAANPDTKQAGASSVKSSASTTPETSDAAGSGDGADQKDGPLAEPITVAAPAAKPAASSPEPTAARPSAEPPAPPAPSNAAPAVPTTGGVWRSAYEAGRSGNGAAQPAPDDAATQPGLVSAIGRVSVKADAPTSPSAAQDSDETAKSWNRVSAPDAPPAPPAPPAADTAGADGVRAGAMKAAQAALDAARSAAKKVSSIMPDDEERPAATPSAAGGTRPEMHYTAGGVRGTATPAGAPAAAAPGPQSPARPASTPTPEVPRPAPAGPRRVRLAISRVDPWSVMKLAFLLAVAIAIMTVVATAVFWSVLNSFGVFTTVQSFVADAVGPQSNVNLTQYVEFPRVISLATLISICNIVLLTAIATIMAFLYNITAALVGGVHMTLTDD